MSCRSSHNGPSANDDSILDNSFGARGSRTPSMADFDGGPEIKNNDRLFAIFG